MYLGGRRVAIENVAQHLPLTVHARPRLHELPFVLDALSLGTVQAELVGAGGDRQVSGARYDDLGRLKGEGKVRRFQYRGPRRPHCSAPAHARSARRQDLPVLGVDVADRRRVLRGHRLNPSPFQLADGPLFGGDVGVAGATARACGRGEGEDQAVAQSPSQREPTAGVGSNSGVFAVALTRSRIHIPAAPCPGTPQAIRYSPAGCAAKRMSSVASEGSPCASLSVKARGIAGSPGRAGGGVCGAITSALCGKTPSWLRKSISVCQPTGTTSVSCPSRNPLKFRAPLSPVSPAINWKRTVLAAVSKLSQVGSAFCCWAVAGAAAEGERRFATDSAYTADRSGGKGSSES